MALKELNGCENELETANDKLASIADCWEDIVDSNFLESKREKDDDDVCRVDNRDFIGSLFRKLLDFLRRDGSFFVELNGL